MTAPWWPPTLVIASRSPPTWSAPVWPTSSTQRSTRASSPCSPGPTATPIQSKFELDEEAVGEQQALIGPRLLAARMADARELAEAARFLLTEASGFAYGSILNVDGGLSL